MSIAIHSSSVSGRPDRAADMPAVGRHRHPERAFRGPERTPESGTPKSRQALMGALSDALASLSTGAEAPAAGGDAAAAPVDGKAQKAALHAFAHELFDALRPSGSEDGGPGRHGRGFAWGRTSLGDIAQRLEALAQRLTGAPANPTPATPAAPSTDPAAVPAAGPPTAEASTTAATAASPDSTVRASPAVPATPTTDPAAVATTAPAATTPVPLPAPVVAAADSPLLSAFRRLTSALRGSTADGAAAGSATDQLAAFLHRMAASLTGSGNDVPAVGSLVDVSA